MRCQYPEEFKFRVPAGFTQALTERASREGIGASEYVRRLVTSQLRASVQNDDVGASAASMAGGKRH